MRINFLALDVSLIGKKPKTPHATSSFTVTMSTFKLRDDTHMTSMKVVEFSKPPAPVHLRPKFFYILDLGRLISRKPPLSK